MYPTNTVYQNRPTSALKRQILSSCTTIDWVTSECLFAHCMFEFNTTLVLKEFSEHVHFTSSDIKITPVMFVQERVNRLAKLVGQISWTERFLWSFGPLVALQSCFCISGSGVLFISCTCTRMHMHKCIPPTVTDETIYQQVVVTRQIRGNMPGKTGKMTASY